MTEQAYPWDTPDRASYSHYNHLLTEAAQARYVLAAHYVEDCAHIVEIGGSRTPITRFVKRPPESILVLDPKMQAFHAETLRGLPCRVDHLRRTFQAHDFALPAGSYGLVILGLSLKHFADLPASESDPNAPAHIPADAPDWRKLIGLIDNARISVIEHPVGWELGEREIDAILAQTATRVKLELVLDLGENEGEDTPYPRRRLLVLEPAPGDLAPGESA